MLVLAKERHKFPNKVNKEMLCCSSCDVELRLCGMKIIYFWKIVTKNSLEKEEIFLHAIGLVLAK